MYMVAQSEPQDTLGKAVSSLGAYSRLFCSWQPLVVCLFGCGLSALVFDRDGWNGPWFDAKFCHVRWSFDFWKGYMQTGSCRDVSDSCVCFFLNCQAGSRLWLWRNFERYVVWSFEEAELREVPVRWKSRYIQTNSNKQDRTRNVKKCHGRADVEQTHEVSTFILWIDVRTFVHIYIAKFNILQACT